MPLKIGSWTVNTGGTVGKLSIDEIDSGNTVSGTLDNGDGPMQIEGFWDEDSQRLVFSCSRKVAGPALAEKLQLPEELQLMGIYTGFLFEDPVRITGLAGRRVYSLVGYFEPFGSWQTTRQHTSGWYAQIGLD
jgi:hypothetical protein